MVPRGPWWDALPWIVTLAAIFGALVLCGTVRAQIPEGAHRYRHEYQRIARSEWGLNAPVASLAAQIHQESAWDCRAISRVGAGGCAQFMPATARWIGDIDHRLKAGDVHSPAWAFRAQAVYMRWLVERVKAENACEQMAFGMQAYNSGLGWVYKRQRLSKTPGRCFGAACVVNPGVHPANQKEAQEYPDRILKRLAPRYVRAGWGPNQCG